VSFEIDNLLKYQSINNIELNMSIKGEVIYPVGKYLSIQFVV